VTALVVVAHPDDEIVFLGGVMFALREAGHRVDVVCVTSRFATAPLTRVRRSELHRAAERLDARALTLDLADRPGPLPLETLSARLAQAVDLSAYDEIYTHGIWGEYGHRHHIDVCVAVHRLARDVWSLAGPLPYVRTVAVDVTRKRALARALYPSQGFASGWCSPVERLTRLDLPTVEALRLVARATSGEENELARRAPLPRPLATLANQALTGLEPTPPFAEVANIPPAVWEPARALWRGRLRSLHASENRLDEELGPARAHAAGGLRPAGEECA